ncbi:MAG: bacillithiol transferase BstA [Candidatus Cohnella colombiensis]|uniref:Bacillithiol transferase BstA n=1 Tax=Candidatus Cohnella colombiensis TaxID=3121368 RepID=A0AA95JC00_9BACL|nr:MAG: bacillithiol transferase BstA [Cohnella sp.]
MDSRYPIGKFQYDAESFSTLRNEWINQIDELPIKLKEAVKDLTPEQLNITYRDGGWTFKQVVHHLADSHMNSYIRFKLALTEDTPTIKPYYEDRWAELQDSVNTDINISITLLEALHKKWVTLLRSMNEFDFKKQYYHPESQQKFGLDYCLGLYAWHGNHHVAHIISKRRELII